MPNNYSRGKIYKIVCRKTGLQYFGSTTEPTLARRLAGHVGNFKTWKKNKEKYDFFTSFEVLREDDYYIELIELVPCFSNDELKVRERFHIQNNECVNKYIPLRTHKEYYEDNKEKRLEYAKEYRDEHKEEITGKKKEYAQINKEKIAEKKKEWYKSNKEKMIEKYDCPCGSTIYKRTKARHENSIKHQNYLKKQLENAEKSLENNTTIEYANCI